MQTTVSHSTAAQNLRHPRNGNTDPYYGQQEASASGSFLPEWFRLPRAGTRDPHYGLSRSMWNQLVLACVSNSYQPPIKSISLRGKNTVKGVRLISAQSASDYFKKLETEQCPPAGPETPQTQETNFEACRLDSEQKSPNPPDFIQPTTHASIEGCGGSEKE